MGCDIHVHAEKKNSSGEWVSLGNLGYDGPLCNRSYGIFGFLAGVRNYSEVTPISEPRGLPDDASTSTCNDFEWCEAHTPSWLTLEELLTFDYDAIVEDRRVTVNGDGGCTCKPGEGEKMTYREFLGGGFFRDLEELKEMGAERIVFWFDN